MPWDTACLLLASSDTVFGELARLMVTAEQFVINLSASWWVFVPSLKLFPEARTAPGTRRSRRWRICVRC